MGVIRAGLFYKREEMAKKHKFHKLATAHHPTKGPDPLRLRRIDGYLIADLRERGYAITHEDISSGQDGLPRKHSLHFRRADIGCNGYLSEHLGELWTELMLSGPTGLELFLLTPLWGADSRWATAVPDQDKNAHIGDLQTDLLSDDVLGLLTLFVVEALPDQTG